jgi:hypothetical protein
MNSPDGYRALGYSVFPCDGKRPARCSTWPNSEDFRPGDNIGLVVGEGLVVLDLDLKPGVDGKALLGSLKPPGWKHRGPRAATGGGGWHLWFKAPPLLGLGNSRGDLPVGIDVRGGGRGYVVAPPSIHPETGAEYEWVVPLVPPGELPEIPQWLLSHLLAAPAVSEGAARAAAGARDLDPYLQAVIEGETAAIRDASEGAGNDTINRAAFKMGGYSHVGLTRADAETAVAAGISVWSWAKAADERAAWRTFESGWQSGCRLPRAVPERRAAAGGGGRRAPDEPPHSALGGHPESSDSGSMAPQDGDLVSAQEIIKISTDEASVNDQAVAALARAGYPDLYQRAGALTRVVRVTSKPGDKLRLDDAPVIRPLSNATLRERLADSAQWLRANSEGWKPAHPPQWSVLAVADRGEYPDIPPLRGIASYPMIRTDGTVATDAGYDAGTGYYLGALPGDLDLAQDPTRDDAAAAAGRLLELVKDFPFRGDTDRAAWLAYLLTPLARAVIDGPTPLFLVEANVRGSGKTLLADVAGLALTGRPLPAHTYPWGDEELEKVLVGVARMGLPIMCFDNVTGDLGGACLDKWLTSTSPTGRVLGSNEVPQFDWTTVLVATANNAAIAGDTDRRSIYVTLETEHERPELRDGFEIPNLPAHLVANRGRILSDALCILQAHHDAGCPGSSGRSKGTFESWCRRVRDAVMFAGLEDCERAPDDDARPVDAESDELACLLAALWEHFAGSDFTVSSILDAAFPSSGMVQSTARDLRDVLGSMSPRDQPTRQLLGKRLARYRNRWLNDLTLNSVKDKHRKIQVWRINERKTAGSTGSCGESRPLRLSWSDEKVTQKEGGKLTATTLTTREGDWSF